MDIAEIVVLIGVILLIVFTLWFFFGKRDDESQTSQPIYACPMPPWITSTDPTDNCSLCGMQLVRSGGARATVEAS